MTSNGRERNERKGVLPRQALRVLIDQGHISSSIEIPDRNIQPASIDLTLGDVAYRLRCSFLPGTSLVRDKLNEYAMDEIDLTGKGAVLEQNRPYLIPLKERLRLPKGIRGRTNPRSSTGRLDVFTRVITDMGGHFDEVRDGYEGELFLEVVPMSFTIKVRTGITLNQLRLMSGIARLSDDELLDLSTQGPDHLPGGFVRTGRPRGRLGRALPQRRPLREVLRRVPSQEEHRRSSISISATRTKSAISGNASSHRAES